MIERIGDMPEGTVGFRANGKVTADDYKQVLEPGLLEAIAIRPAWARCHPGSR